ncbi:MAG TPA: hypothetical protein VJT73_07705 [Polyangiaceae bacterium]|nr:hypothetical protein [Polyangiaceae bacterium]
MAMAREEKRQELERSRADQSGMANAREPVASARAMLEDAQALTLQVERLLAHPSFQSAESDTFRVRLARAHCLSLLDQISELMGRQNIDLPA